MKPVQDNTGKSDGVRASLANHYLSLNVSKLQQAKLILEQAGFIVTTAPIELWQHRNIINAWHPDLKEGFLIGADELGLICHYGIAALNPHGFESPRYKDKDNSNRIRHYAEAAIARACTEVALSASGTSNSTLNKAAYVIGRFMFGWQLDPDSLQAQLLSVALDRGINEQEARAVIKSGVKAGSKNPRDPNELDDLMNESFGYSSGFRSNSSNQNIYHTESEKKPFGVLGKGSKESGQSFGQLGVTKRFGRL